MKNTTRQKLSRMFKKTLPIYIMTLTCITSAIEPFYHVEAYTIATANDVSITGEAGIVMDFETGQILYEKNADKMMVPASLTKIMTTYIIYEEIEAGNISFDTLMEVSSNASTISRNEGYPQAVPLTAGSKISVDTLIKLILIPSASASCIVVAEHISGSEANFVKRMNETAERLGMEVKYENSHGAKVHYVTARSQLILVQEFIKRFPDVLRYTSIGSMTYNGKTYSNTNRFLSISPYANVDGFKSGNITAAGYCLAATINRDGRRLISVTFKSTSRETLYNDNIKLFEYCYSKLKTNSPVYEGIGTHSARNDIETFYGTGFSPYPLGTTFAADTAMWSEEFNSILRSIVDHYGLASSIPETVDGENLTREKALSMINNVLPFPTGETIYFADRSDIFDGYKTAVDKTISAKILYGANGDNFYPQNTFTKAMAATSIVNLVNYIENNIEILPSDGSSLDKSTSLNTSTSVDIPFSFNTYSSAFSMDSAINTYEPRSVELLSVEEGGWWKVNIDGKNEWLYTQNKLTYADKYQPIYDSPTDLNIVGYITPQTLSVLDEQGDYIKIATWLGESWVSSNGTNNNLKSQTIFNIPEGFNLNVSPTIDNFFDPVNQVLYPSQTVELKKIGENGFWYVECEGAEGWYYAKDKYLYVTDNVTLYDKDDDQSNVAGTLNRQVLAIEEVVGEYIKVPTWIGSKWIKY